MNNHTVVLQFRRRVLVLTDPQRRVYNGQPFSSKEVWSEWADVCPFRKSEDAEEAAASYRKINPTREYRVMPL